MKDLLTLTKIKNGDVKAFEQVFRLYYMPLCMFAASITGEWILRKRSYKNYSMCFGRKGNGYNCFIR